MTGGPGKEHGTNKPPPTGRGWERSEGDNTYPITSMNPSCWHPSWLSQNDAKDNPETNPITIKPRALLGSLTLLLSTQLPFPNKISCFVSTCVSSDCSFLSIRQEISFRPWKGSPFLQQFGQKSSLLIILIPIGVVDGGCPLPWDSPGQGEHHKLSATSPVEPSKLGHEFKISRLGGQEPLSTKLEH